MIGVFDSGYGGLTVLRELIKVLPQYSYVYFGDNINAPYGDKDKESVQLYTERGVDFLFKQGARMVILACNTASADALRYIQQKYPNRKILGVLIPTVEEAIKKGKNISIICTKSTALSGAFERELRKLDNQVNINIKPTPLLVPLIEEGLHDNINFTKRLLKEYLSYFDFDKSDVLLLGCTHYPLVKDYIREIVNVKYIVDASEVTAKSLDNYLYRHPEIAVILDKGNSCLLYTSGNVDDFYKMSKKILGEHDYNVYKSE